MARYTPHIKSQTKEEAEKQHRMETRFDGQKPDYHRPYIRKSTQEKVEANAKTNKKGEFLDCNTGKAIPGSHHLGHKYGHEYRHEAQIAKEEGLTQKEFNNKMNDPSLYQIESPESNMSHKYEMSDEEFARQRAAEKEKTDETKNTQTGEVKQEDEMKQEDEVKQDEEVKQEEERQEDETQNTTAETDNDEEDNGENEEDEIDM